MFEKCDSSNRQKWMVASFSISTGFTAKSELTERAQVFLKDGNRDF